MFETSDVSDFFSTRNHYNATGRIGKSQPVALGASHEFDQSRSHQQHGQKQPQTWNAASLPPSSFAAANGHGNGRGNSHNSNSGAGNVGGHAFDSRGGRGNNGFSSDEEPSSPAFSLGSPSMMMSHHDHDQYDHLQQNQFQNQNAAQQQSQQHFQFQQHQQHQQSMHDQRQPPNRGMQPQHEYQGHNQQRQPPQQQRQQQPLPPQRDQFRAANEQHLTIDGFDNSRFRAKNSSKSNSDGASGSSTGGGGIIDDAPVRFFSSSWRSLYDTLQ
jgi:hypothetical protein